MNSYLKDEGKSSSGKTGCQSLDPSLDSNREGVISSSETPDPFPIGNYDEEEGIFGGSDNMNDELLWDQDEQTSITMFNDMNTLPVTDSSIDGNQLLAKSEVAGVNLGQSGNENLFSDEIASDNNNLAPGLSQIPAADVF